MLPFMFEKVSYPKLDSLPIDRIQVGNHLPLKFLKALLLYCLLAAGVAGGEVDGVELLQTLYIFFSFFLELVVISSSRVLNFYDVT